MDTSEYKTLDLYIKALTDISRAITSDLYLDDILKLIVMATAKVTEVEICSLWLVDDDEVPPKIRLKATQSISPEYVKDRSLDMNEGVVGNIVSKKIPIVIKNVIENDLFKEKEMAAELGLVSMIGVPLQLKNKQVIGALNCFTSTAHNFTSTEINMVTAVANQAAVAILNTELMVKTKVIEEELETRKLLDRAKEVLMNRRDMKSDEAYKWIRKRSMDSRKTIRQIADAILISEELY
ncbi:MAG: GAF and ANTAR domain-containing protein [Desulfobacterales bacterium]|nr:GAF and ANTAR domain-containing protein [Desulfobacterales bacterium]MCP4161683.1 GAF and ANTAR domain-containing protein [Deltaproteobacteria bacterium]